MRIYGKVGPDGIGYLPGGGATAKSAPVLNIMASTRAILLGSRGLWPFLPVGLALPGGKVCPFPIEEASQGVVLARPFARDSLEAGKALLKTAAPGSASRDVRVLPVLYDAGDERWRTLQEAIGELEEVEFEDFPLLSGPRTMFLDLRQMRRSGLDFLLQHEAWLKKSGVWSAHNGPFSARARQYMPCPQLDALVRPAELCWIHFRPFSAHLPSQPSPTQPGLGRPTLAQCTAWPAGDCRKFAAFTFGLSFGGAEQAAHVSSSHIKAAQRPRATRGRGFLRVCESAYGSIIDPALTQQAARRAASKAE